MKAQDFYSWCIEHERDNLLAEWNYERNLPIVPDKIARGSDKKVWWKCKEGHEWQAAIGYRGKFNRSCPICKGTHTLVEGINDLETQNPRLAKEWDYEKNGDLRPSMVLPRSMKKVWWVCDKGHHFEATIDNRMVGSGCPICAKEKKTSLPEKAIFYYLTKIWSDVEDNCKFPWLGKSEIDIFIPELKLAIEYDGERWHKDVLKDISKDELLIQHQLDIIRFREPKCPMINDASLCIYTEKPVANASHMNGAIKVLFDILNEKYNINISIDVDVERDVIEILNLYEHKKKKKSLAIQNPQLAAEWNLKRNGVLTPDKVYANAGYKVWWECREGHEWQAVIASRNSGSGCPFCSGKKILVGVNDLEHKFPEVAKDWNYVKNKELGISGPNKISYSSNKKIWWKCYECEYEWQTKVNNRTSKNRTGCPGCAKRMNKSAEFARKTRLKKRGSLLEKQPELCKEWDEEKNKISPAEITCGSNYRAWWFCEKGHHYQAAVSKRAGKRPTGCPYCAGRKILKGFNDMGTRNPQVLCDWNYERNEISPYQISSYSQKKVWWKCHNCGYEWETTPEKKCNYKKSCPKCKISNL